MMITSEGIYGIWLVLFWLVVFALSPFMAALIYAVITWWAGPLALRLMDVLTGDNLYEFYLEQKRRESKDES